MTHNPLGFGVTCKRQRYQAQISYGGSVQYLGSYDTAAEAAAVAHGARLLRAKLERSPIHPDAPAAPPHVLQDSAGRYFACFTLHGAEFTTPRFTTAQAVLDELKAMHQLAH